MTHPFLMVWLLLMIRFEFVYVYFIATKNVGDYSYMSSPNIYYRAKKTDKMYIIKSIRYSRIIKALKFNTFVIAFKDLTKCAVWHNVGLEW